MHSVGKLSRTCASELFAALRQPWMQACPWMQGRRWMYVISGKTIAQRTRRMTCTSTLAKCTAYPLRSVGSEPSSHLDEAQ